MEMLIFFVLVPQGVMDVEILSTIALLIVVFAFAFMAFDAVRRAK